MKEKLERARKAREEHAKAAKNAGPQADTDGSGGPGVGNFYELMNDPEILQAFQVSRRFILCSLCTEVNTVRTVCHV